MGVDVAGLKRQLAAAESSAAENLKRAERAELREQAHNYEHERDTQLARYHHYEVASAAFQIGIVLASATIITGMTVLSFIAVGLGGLGLVFMAIGLWFPHAVHFV